MKIDKIIKISRKDKKVMKIINAIIITFGSQN